MLLLLCMEWWRKEGFHFASKMKKIMKNERRRWWRRRRRRRKHEIMFKDGDERVLLSGGKLKIIFGFLCVFWFAFGFCCFGNLCCVQRTERLSVCVVPYSYWAATICVLMCGEHCTTGAQTQTITFSLHSLRFPNFLFWVGRGSFSAQPRNHSAEQNFLWTHTHKTSIDKGPYLINFIYGFERCPNAVWRWRGEWEQQKKNGKGRSRYEFFYFTTPDTMNSFHRQSSATASECVLAPVE